jgi:hypothetical protein
MPVLRSSKIEFLKNCIPNSDLIFNGQMLSDAQTIDFYDIQSGDSLVALSSGNCPADAARWLQFTHDFDTFTNCIQSMTNQISRKESMRLRDLRGLKWELRPRGFRKLCCEEIFLKNKHGSGINSVPTVIPKDATAVSDTPLPVCW